MAPQAPAPPVAPTPEKEASAERKLRLSVGEYRKTGRNKVETQDKGYYDEEKGLLSVCDGVSTGDGGAAAEFVSNRFGDYFGDQWRGVPRNIAEKRIVEGMQKVDEELYRKKEAGDIHKGSSTVGGLIKFCTDKQGKQYAVVGGAGDIIITRTFNDVDPDDPTKTVRRTVRLNPEESVSANDVRTGKSTTYDPNPRKVNTVYNSWSGRYAEYAEGVGPAGPVDIRQGFHIVTVDVEPGDEFAICTDGVEGAANDPADLVNWADGRVSPAYCEIMEDPTTTPEEKAKALSDAEKRLVTKRGVAGKGDDELNIIAKIEAVATPRPGTLELSTTAIRKLVAFGGEKLTDQREKRGGELQLRREKLDKETLASGIQFRLTPEALSARKEALEIGVRMQRASRKEQRALQAEFDEKVTAYQDALISLPKGTDNWSPEFIHTLRSLDAKETRLQILEQTGLKGAALEYMGKHKIKTAVGAAAVSLVLTGGIGFIGAAAGGAAAASLATAGGTAALRAVRGYSTAISRRYAPGRMEREGTQSEDQSKALKTLALGGAALVASVTNMELGGSKLLSMLLAGGGIGAGVAGVMPWVRDRSYRPSVEVMTNSERAAFIAGGVSEMLKEDNRTRKRALGFTAVSVIAGAAAAEYLHGAFSGGHHSVSSHEVRAPKTSPSPTGTPSSHPTGPSAPDVPSHPVAPTPGNSAPAPGKSLDMDKALSDIKTHSPAGEITRDEGFYDHIDRLVKASPAFKNTNLTPDQYREVMLRSGKELSRMKFANGQSIAYAVHSGGHIQAYGFNSVGQLPPAANEVVMRHLAEVQGLRVSNDPAASAHLLDQVSFGNAVEHAPVHSDTELAQNLYPKMSQLNALGVTNNDYAALTQQLHNNGFTFPANGQLTQAQLEQIVSTAATQKHIDLQAMHNLVVTSPDHSVDSLFSNLPKELVAHQANASFGETLQKIPQLQPLGLDLTDPATVNNVAQKLQQSQPGLVKLEGQTWVFAHTGKLNTTSFQAILKAVSPKVHQQYALAS
ncbi:MAG TPA: hypothetical protein VLF60_01060 [Candidatus Saccharimonadales bacterium]|nr:hypothetical protein [Candidatus Saccharimonadales bacterium]